jgi:hypothetical protein
MMQLKSKCKKLECSNVKNTPLNISNNEEGVAIIMALIMLLVMSVLATTVSFNSNNDFHAMSNYKQGQEAFLAAERCIQEGRNRFEVVTVAYLASLESYRLPGTLGQGDGGDVTVLDEELDNGSRCRSGQRGDKVPAKLFQSAEDSKANSRLIKNTQMSNDSASLTTVPFTVTGKDRRDKDKNDTNDNINTGTEIAVGLEVFTLGTHNIYGKGK